MKDFALKVERYNDIRFLIWLALLFPLYIVLYVHVRPIVQNIWLDDTLIIADAGARLIEGKIPHNDYFSPIGVLTSALVALGLLLKNMKIEGVYLIAEIFGGVSATLIYYFSLRRGLSWYLAFLIGALALVFLVSLRPLGFAPGMITLSGLYNRVGWVLLAFLFVNVLTFEKAPRFSAILSGVLLSLLLATKLNLFLAGVLLLAPYLFCHFKTILRLGLTFVIATAAWLLVFGISPSRFLADNLVVTSAMPQEKKIGRLLEILAQNRTEFLISFLFVSLIAIPFLKRREYKAVLCGFAFYVGTLVAALLAGIGSIAGNEYLLSYLSPLCIYLYGTPKYAASRNLAAFAVVGYFSFLTFRADYYSNQFIHTLSAEAGNPNYCAKIESPRFENFYALTWPNQVGEDLIRKAALERTIEPAPAAYALWYSKALELTQPIENRNLAVLSLIQDQAFSYVSGFRHTYNDFLFYHVGRVNKETFPNDMVSAVNNADIILIPKHLETDSTSSGERRVVNAYFPLMKDRFQLLRENEFWALWAKR